MERPMLFSAPMVRALLAGTKTQTRRIIKPQPEPYEWPNGRQFAFINPEPGYLAIGIDCPDCHRYSKYGVVGDRIWVKETFHHGDAWYPDRKGMEWKNCHRDGQCTWVDYRATYKPDPGDERNFPWKPSIFMPRWASRITLEIKSIRVERLQEISEEDAEGEGVDSSYLWDHGIRTNTPFVSGYAHLWESINGPGSWDRNSWVWAITFKKL